MVIHQLKKSISLRPKRISYTGLLRAIPALVNLYRVLAITCVASCASSQVINPDSQGSNSSITADKSINSEFSSSTMGVGAISVFSIFGFFGLSLFCYSRLFPNSQIYHISDSDESKEEPRPQ